MTKRWFAALMVILMILVSAVTQAQSSTVYGLMLDNNVQVRVGPDYAYPIIDRLPRDASVTVVGRAGDFYYAFQGREWLYVQYGDRAGWVLGRTVRMGRAFNAIPVTALSLPRNRDGRVPEEFDLSINICDRWQGEFTQSGDFMAGADSMTFNFPAMPGTVNYSVVIIAPSGLQRTFDTPDTSISVRVGSLNWEGGAYTWSVIPYWNDTRDPWRAQQLCVMRQGSTFDKPDTTPPTPTPYF